jgi:GcrA cell cycle regulator
MQSINWAPEHSAALREYLAKGMSYSEIANAINAKFKTAYSRNAAIGRAKRMGLAGPDQRKDLPKHRRPTPPPKVQQPRLRKPRKGYAPEFMRPTPIFERTDADKLRCVEIDPRHLSLTDLERGDCRYPYGGDEEGEAITFCGHRRRQGSSYCAPHFHLTRDRVGTGRRHRLTPACGGGIKRASETDSGNHDRQNEAAAAPLPHRAFA